jgi:hypothetical protein
MGPARAIRVGPQRQCQFDCSVVELDGVDEIMKGTGVSVIRGREVLVVCSLPGAPDGRFPQRYTSVSQKPGARVNHILNLTFLAKYLLQ